MPDFDALMAEFTPELEQALKDIPFPGAEIDMHPADYSRLVMTMLDVPQHKLANNKSLIEKFIGLSTNVTNLSIKKWFSKRLTFRRREQAHLKTSMVALGDKVA